MNAIEFEQGVFTVDAEVIAAALGIESERVQPLMHDGKITSLCERGVGEDIGRHRLTFFYANCAYHLIVDEEDHVIERGGVASYREFAEQPTLGRCAPENHYRQ